MKYCLLLSGQPRFFKIGYEYIKKFIIDQNGEPDTFIHAWWDESEVNKEYDASCWNLGKADQPRLGDKEEIIRLYQPKGYFFEKHKKFIVPREHSYKSDQPEWLPYSMFWSLKEANRLKEIYEIDHGFKYDFAFRLRFDSAFQKPINLNEFDNSNLYLHNNCQSNPGATPGSYCDQVAFGNSWDLGLYADIYYFMEKYYLAGAKYIQETLLGWHLDGHGVKVVPLDLGFGLIRGTEEKDVQWIK